MRHLKGTKKFNRTTAHKKAMFSNMLVSFFSHESIKTTTTKAKELRKISEKIITRAKEPTLHNKRIVLKKIKDRDVVAKLFDEIAPRYKNLPGGYTRIIKLGDRMGDGAELSLIELVSVQSKPEHKPKGKKKEEEKEEK
jgi:large subunit ribosomal protein L17